ncbi:hypothetical protein POM88_027599 [Heracleum sosnowskyi]|uniref:Serine protease n=1 Tax=Heracleum sosnowskyi TaxID=360622 RepID=A0AAD8I8P8_9APIA|nr:hypothetical protein POM88_027599 [Heracleum sosnowskyi]
MDLRMLETFQKRVEESAKATVIIRETNDPKKLRKFSTGFVVGHLGVGSSCVIFTAGHVATSCLVKLEVVFYGHPDKVFPATIILHLPRAEILILKVEKPKEIETGKLVFESKDKWDLGFLEPLAAVSHPSGREFSAGLSIVNRPEFKNTTIKEYASEMELFDHSLQFAAGSSGAALINIRGHVAGLQAGELVSDYVALSGEPIWDALACRKEKAEGLWKDIVAVCLSDLVLGYDHVKFIRSILCCLKQAVHVKFIDRALREYIGKVVHSNGNLNDVITRYVRYVTIKNMPNIAASSYPYSPSHPPYSFHPSSPPSDPYSPSYSPCSTHPSSPPSGSWVNSSVNKEPGDLGISSIANSQCLLPVQQVTDLYHPLALRHFLLGTQYLSPADQYISQIEKASEAVFQIYQTLQDCQDAVSSLQEGSVDALSEPRGESVCIKDAAQECIRSLQSDTKKVSNDLQSFSLLNFAVPKALELMNWSLSLLKVKEQQQSVIQSLVELEKEVGVALDVFGLLCLNYSEVLEQLKCKALNRSGLEQVQGDAAKVDDKALASEDVGGWKNDGRVNRTSDGEMNDMADLQCSSPTQQPRGTDYMEQISHWNSQKFGKNLKVEDNSGLLMGKINDAIANMPEELQNDPAAREKRFFDIFDKDQHGPMQCMGQNVTPTMIYGRRGGAPISAPILSRLWGPNCCFIGGAHCCCL